MTAYRAFLRKQIEEGTAAVEGLVHHFPADRWEWQPNPRRWSARQNLNHLRNVERRYCERLEGVLAHGEYVPAARPETEPADDAESIPQILDDFVALRRRESELFAGLRDEQWRHEFDHPTLWGRISVEFWAERIVDHACEHIEALWMLRQLQAIQPDRLEKIAAAF